MFADEIHTYLYSRTKRILRASSETFEYPSDLISLRLHLRKSLHIRHLQRTVSFVSRHFTSPFFGSTVKQATYKILSHFISVLPPPRGQNPLTNEKGGAHRW